MNIYIGNMSFDTTEDQLRQAFEGFGEVSTVNVVTDRDSGRPRGFAFVEMASKSEAVAAISGLNGQELNGREVNVNEAKPRRWKPLPQIVLAVNQETRIDPGTGPRIKETGAAPVSFLFCLVNLFPPA